MRTALKFFVAVILLNCLQLCELKAQDAVVWEYHPGGGIRGGELYPDGEHTVILVSRRNELDKLEFFLEKWNFRTNELIAEVRLPESWDDVKSEITMSDDGEHIFFAPGNFSHYIYHYDAGLNLVDTLDLGEWANNWSNLTATKNYLLGLSGVHWIWDIHTGELIDKTSDFTYLSLSESTTVSPNEKYIATNSVTNFPGRIAFYDFPNPGSATDTLFTIPLSFSKYPYVLSGYKFNADASKLIGTLLDTLVVYDVNARKMLYNHIVSDNEYGHKPYLTTTYPDFEDNYTIGDFRMEKGGYAVKIDLETGQVLDSYNSNIIEKFGGMDILDFNAEHDLFCGRAGIVHSETDIDLKYFIIDTKVPVSVKNSEYSNLEILYPNPTNSYVAIIGIKQVLQINIYDISSNLVLSVPENEVQLTAEGISFSVDQLNAGTYFIRIGEKSYKLMKN